MQKEFTKNGFDITVDQWVVLYELYQDNDLSQNQIAELTFKDAPTITRIIDLLGKKKYLERKASKEDRRKFEIHLTSFGKKKVKQFLPVVVKLREKGWENLSDKQYKDLTNILDTVFDNFEQENE